MNNTNIDFSREAFYQTQKPTILNTRITISSVSQVQILYFISYLDKPPAWTACSALTLWLPMNYSERKNCTATASQRLSDKTLFPCVFISANACLKEKCAHILFRLIFIIKCLDVCEFFVEISFCIIVLHPNACFALNGLYHAVLQLSASGLVMYAKMFPLVL